MGKREYLEIEVRYKKYTSTSITNQKMKKEICSLFALILFSCTNKTDHNLVIFNLLNEGLINSNNVISTENQMIYHSFESKLEDPESHEKAILWQPKIMLVQKISTDMTAYIEGLKQDLKVEANLKAKNKNEVSDEDDAALVVKLFITEERAEQLYNKLKDYKDTLIHIDPYISKEFSSIITITTQNFDSSIEKNKDFTQFFFANASTVTALAILTKFQSNIIINENKLINFINRNIIFHEPFFTLLYPLIAQSSSYVTTGQEIQITVGMGSFTTRPEPIISINDKTIKIEPEGIAVYKFKASGKEGKHYTTVNIEYVDLVGKKVSFSKKIEYMVSNCGIQKN
ncbi:MAG: hypothetical protein ABI921_03705 [Panacibacter sp.]